MAINKDLLEQARKLCLSYSSHYMTRDGNGEYSNEAAFHPLYDQTIEVAHSVATHYVWGADASHLIEKGRPYEPKAIKDYRKEAYEQETYSHGQRILGLIKGSLSHEQLFSIHYSEPPVSASKEGLRLEDYFTKQMPLPVSSLDTYFWEFIFQMALVDPNGWVAMMQDYSDKELKSNPDQLREPYPAFVNSENVYKHGRGYVLVSSGYTHKLGHGLEAEEFFYFTKDVTFKCCPRLIGAAQNRKIDYDIIVWHEHFFGELQIRQVGGVISAASKTVLGRGAQVPHLSHLQPTIPDFNKAVRYLSDLDAHFISHMHPIKVEEMLECRDCKKGRTLDGEVCKTCQGSGLVQPDNSILSGYIKQPNQKTGKLESPVMYVTPPHEIFNSAAKFVWSKIIGAYEGVNAAFLIKEQTGQPEAARSRELQRQPLLLLFKQVGGTIFPLYQWILDMGNRIRYQPILGKEYEQNRAIVQPPRNYDTAIISMVIDELVQLEATSMPDSVVNRVYQNAIIKRFGKDSETSKLMTTYLQVDIYANKSEDDLLAMSASGGLDPTRHYLHNNVVLLVDDCIASINNFLDLPETEKREKVLEKATEKVNASTGSE